MKSKILLVLFCILLAQYAIATADIIVTEGDLVNISVASDDPDNDKLFTTFTTPVNNKGLWQTENGDAGSYYTNVSVCDMELCDSQIINIYVLAKKNPPEILSYSPRDLNLSIKEGYSVLFNVEIEDKDSSKLYISWKLDNKEVSNNLTYQYNSDFYSAGEHSIRFIVSDGDLQDQILWDLDVKDVNAPPVLAPIDDITATEGDLIKITPVASDPDNDKITYSFSNPLNSSGEWQTGFDDEGVYDMIITANDGILSDSKTIKLNIENNDRAPMLFDTSPKEDKVYLKEGEDILFSVNAVDPDGDKLDYTWTIDDSEAGYKKSIKYSPDYKSAGVKIVQCTIYDGTVKTSKKWVLVIEDVNQPPVLRLEDAYYFDEGSLANIVPNATDPDGDKITYFFSSPLDNNGEWQTSYKDSGVYAVNISASDGELISSEYVKFIINDISVPPVFENMTYFYAEEGSNISIRLNAYTPGGEDIIFSSENLPRGAYIEGDKLKWSIDYDSVKRNSGWFGRLLKKLDIYSPLFSDSKDFIIKIKAEAGKSFSFQDVKILINDRNRIPEISNLPSKITADEGDMIKVDYTIYDADNDSLKLSLPAQFNKKGEWQTGFDDSGLYNFSLRVDDNLNSTVRNFLVIVNNKNREPIISAQDYIRVKAGKEIRLKPVVMDLDNDNLTIEYSGWMESDRYLTNINETGIHTVTISVYDGTTTVNKDITVEVKKPGLVWFYTRFILLGLLLLAILIFIINFIEKKRADKKAEEERLREICEEDERKKREEKERLGKARLKKVKELMDIK